MPMNKHLPIKPCPLSISNNTSTGLSSIVRTSKNWVLPPRPKPGRKSSTSQKRSRITKSQPVQHQNINITSAVKKINSTNIEPTKTANKSVSEIINNNEASVLYLDDCTLSFLKFEDDESSSKLVLNEDLKNLKTIAFDNSNLAQLVDPISSEEIDGFSSSSSSDTPNSLFSADHYILSNDSFDVGTDLEDKPKDFLCDYSQMNLNLKLNFNNESDFLPILFSSSTLASDYTSPSLEELIDEQDTNNILC